MPTYDVRTEIADMYLGNTEDHFDDWLAGKAASADDKTYGLVWSAYLAETIDMDEWAREYSSGQ